MTKTGGTDSSEGMGFGLDARLGEILASPPPLTGDPRRQAVNSIRGTVYQAWRSIDEWLRLIDDSTVIYLEGVEDFDVVSEGNAVTVQVRNTSQSISLGTRKAQLALEGFWTISAAEPLRLVEFHYLTTSSTALESDANFDGFAGIDAWRIAQTDTAVAAKVAKYLAAKLADDSSLHRFLTSSPPEIIQERLIRRFHWLVSEPDLDVIRSSVSDRIVSILAAQNRPASLAHVVRSAIESRFWELILQSEPSARCLTHRELIRLVSESTHTYLPIPLEQFPALLAAARPGHGLMQLLLQKVPVPPEPLLDRRILRSRLDGLLAERKVVLITGSVYKGKTTLAQLAAASLCPEAWWINLSDRQPRETDNLILALGQRIEQDDVPNLVILDDLDITESSYRTYRTSLQLLSQRAHGAARRLLITARGDATNASVVRDIKNLELVEVEALDHEELANLCVANGCPSETAQGWSFFIGTTTGGHPKLVQVRIQELVDQGWSIPPGIELIQASPAITSVRHATRELLSQTTQPAVTEFVYTLAESSVPLHRAVAIRLAETVQGLTNAGDVVSGLIGRWLEEVGEGRVRATALLRNAGADVWSVEKRQTAHVRLYEALHSKSPLSPDEAAAILFHAFVANDQRRLALSAAKLQLIDDPEAVNQVNRHLQWLTWIALEPGQRIAADARTGSMLRAVQFRVAITIESDSLTRVCERWAEEVNRIEDEEFGVVARALRALSLGLTSASLPLSFRLEAIAAAQTIPDDLATTHTLPQSFTGTEGIRVSPTQAMLLHCITSVRGYEQLEELVDWLETIATPRHLRDFETLLEWPIVQTLGAFVQSAWTAVHEEINDWTPWLTLFDRIERLAVHRQLPRFGREAAKARALILAEYLGRAQEALAALDRASEVFGQSPVLMEQRANVLFQVKDDEGVLDTWELLTSDQSATPVLDPFAYRRVAISAARLGHWAQSCELFLAGAEQWDESFTQPTYFGLMIDAAHVSALGGELCRSARILVDALKLLPKQAAEEGNLRWEAALRVASEICRFVSARVANTKPAHTIEFGWASSPALILAKAEPGQAVREQFLRAEIFRLAAAVCRAGPDTSTQIALLSNAPFAAVRYVAIQAQLALTYDRGPSADFISTLLALEQAAFDLAQCKRRGSSPLESDDGARSAVHREPERLRSLVLAALVCAGNTLLQELEAWKDSSARELGADAPLTKMLRSLLAGASRPTEHLEPTVRDSSAEAPIRLGAAVRLLQEIQAADVALQLQVFTASAMVDSVGMSLEVLWNRHVARRFAGDWKRLSENRFQFINPRQTVPSLLLEIEKISNGIGTLGGLLTAAHDSLGKRLPMSLTMLS